MSRPATTSPRRRSRQLRAWVLMVVVLLMINLPLVHSTWNRWRLESSGTVVSAEVADEEVRGSGSDARHYVAFRLPEEVDGEEVAERFRRWTVQVDQDAHERARQAGVIDVRVLADRPTVFRADGQVRSNAALVFALLADALVLGIAFLLWRFRGRLRPRLTLLATGDVVASDGGPLLERAEDDQYVVRGEVSEVDGDRLVLDLGDRSVLVDLDGHRGDVLSQETVEVRGLLVD